MINKVLLVILTIFGLSYLTYQLYNFIKNYKKLENYSFLKCALIGLPTGFLDVLGVGSFVTSTLLLTKTKQVDDKYLPGVLNVAFALPGTLEAIFFIDNISVDPTTLFLLTISGIMGSFLCSIFVAKLCRRKIRFILGIALFISAIFILINQLNLIKIGGDKFILRGVDLIIGIIGMFIFGAGMCLGVGLFAPGMVLLYLLGMSPIAVLPILMGSSAFIMLTSGYNFMRKKAYEIKNSTSLTLGYSIGVLISSFMVININTAILKWILLIVILYTSITLIKPALKENEKKC